jgi:hypothetical protein
MHIPNSLTTPGPSLIKKITRPAFVLGYSDALKGKPYREAWDLPCEKGEVVCNVGWAYERGRLLVAFMRGEGIIPPTRIMVDPWTIEPMFVEGFKRAMAARALR